MALVQIVIFVLLGSAITASSICAQGDANGAILEQKKYSFPQFEKLSIKNPPFTKLEYDAAKSGEFQTERIAYLSDGLKVAAYLYRPKERNGRLPIIVFNRGGYTRGNIAPELVVIFHRLAQHGFAVVAPLYRGSDGGEGKDEVGGDDLADLMNVVPLIKSFDFADGQNIFLYGESRGGMMVFQAIRDKFPANAAATYGAFSNFSDLVAANERQYLPLLHMIWADYDSRKAEVAQRRSVISWVKNISIPVLLMHGGADRSVNPMQTLRLAQLLEEQGKPYELLIYEGDNHSIIRNQSDRDERAAAWFMKHLKK